MSVNGVVLVGIGALGISQSVLVAYGLDGTLVRRGGRADADPGVICCRVLRGQRTIGRHEHDGDRLKCTREVFLYVVAVRASSQVSDFILAAR